MKGCFRLLALRLVTPLSALAALLAAPLARAEYTPPPPSQLVNVSVRTKLDATNPSLTVGFVISGTAPARVLMRAIGPSLRRFGVTDYLVSPKLVLTAKSGTGSTSLTNTNWQTPIAPLVSTDSIKQMRIEVQNTGFPLGISDRDAAVLADLSPGSYTITVSADIAGDAGTVLAEVYNVNYTAKPDEVRLSNLSVLGYYSETSPLLAGFVVYGGGGNRFLLRCVGPGLKAFGVQDAISDCNMELINQNQYGAISVATNEDWDYTPFTTLRVRQDSVLVGAFPLVPNGRDAALSTGLWNNVPEEGYLGNYTLRGSGPAGAKGKMLLEIYEVRPEPTDY